MKKEKNEIIKGKGKKKGTGKTKRERKEARKEEREKGRKKKSLGRPTWPSTATARTAVPISITECVHYFRVQTVVYSCQCWGSCAQMLMRVTAHGGCTDTVRVSTGSKLQALVYDILPSTTAVFSYAIGSRKLSANEQFFCWCSNSNRFVTNNSK